MGIPVILVFLIQGGKKEVQIFFIDKKFIRNIFGSRFVKDPCFERMSAIFSENP